MGNVDSNLARHNMVEQQVRPWDVLDQKVLETLEQIPRENFVPDRYKNLAYADTEIPLGNGFGMMHPVLEGRLLQFLDIQPAGRHPGNRHRQWLYHRLPGPSGPPCHQH